MHGVAVLLGVTAVRRGGGLHTEQGGGGHLAAGHAVDAVVHEDHGDVLAPVGGGHGLGKADGGQVAVALIGEHQLVGLGALYAGGHGAGPAVRTGGAVVGDILHGKAAAADAVDGDGLFQHTQLLQHLADELEDGAVHTAGAEAHHHVVPDALRSPVYLLHHAPSLSRTAFAAATTRSRLMISPPLRRQVWMG